jgi:hypothetical protein
MSDDALLKEEPQQEVQAEDEGYTQALLAIAGLLSVLFMFLFYLINPFIPVDSSGLFSDTLWISIPLWVLLIGKIWQFCGAIWPSGFLLIKGRQPVYSTFLFCALFFCIFHFIRCGL